MEVASFTVARDKLSVPVNGIHVPIKTLADSIRRFCTPAFFHHENQPVYEMSKAGSAFLLRYRGRNLAICTGHQLGHGEHKVLPEQFAVVQEAPDGKKVGLSPTTVSQPKVEEPEYANLEDLILLEYENTRGPHDLRRLFLDLDIATPLKAVARNSIKTIFAIGYPTTAGEFSIKYDQDFNVTQMDMTLRWVKIYFDLAEAAPLDPENRIPLVQSERADQETIEPDGMSGSPVFFVWLDPASNAHLGFAGIVTHARGRRYMIYDGAHVRQVLDMYIDQAMNFPK